MAITFAQNIAGVSYSGATSTTANFAACQASSLLVASATMEDSSTTMTVSDDVNGSYTADAFVNGGQAGAGAGSAGVFSKQNSSTSAKTVTLTLGTSTYGFLKIQELTGCPVSSAVDVANTFVTSTSQAYSLALASVGDNSAIVEVNTHYASGMGTDGGYTASFTETALFFSYHYGEYIADAGAAGTKTLTHASYSPVPNATGAAVAYKVAPTATPGGLAANLTNHPHPVVAFHYAKRAM